MQIGERKRGILREVILRFIDSAEPVSSQNIAENAKMGLSSATIRKEMAELEELGYLCHPHTSAGRIPSDKGYRFFVDNFIKNNVSLNPEKINAISKTSTAAISKDINKDMEFETILKKSSEQLARMTNYLSMIIAPAIFNNKFRHIELIELNKGHIMLVLITDAGRVFKKNFLIEGLYNYFDLQATSNILNINFKDKNLSELDFSVLKISESDSYLIPVIKKVINLIKDCISDTLMYNRIYIHGASSVLNQPDFIDIKKIQEILKIIENEYLLANLLLNLSEDDDLIIKIGSEIFEEGIDDLSLVASKYKIYNQSSGTIGVLGPKRMNYFKVVNIINAFIRNFSEIFS